MKRTVSIFSISLAILVFAGLTGATTIHDIQYTTAPGGESPLVGQSVTVIAYVTAEGYAFGSDYYFIQDAGTSWSGIKVNDPSHPVAQGDQVHLTGVVAEVDGMTVIQNVTSHSILSHDNTLYQPLTATTLAMASEQYEGCLVKVSNLTVTNPGPGCADFQVTDGSGACWIGGDAEWYFWPTNGQALAYVTGVVNYSGGQFKLEPRLTNDITPPGISRTLQWVQQVRYSDLLTLQDSSYATSDTVEVEGIVTMPTGLSYAGAGVKFNYQDVHGGPWSGIMCYDPDSTAFPSLFEGFKVKVTGRISEYVTSPASMTEMFITEPIQILGIGQPVPNEPILPTGDLNWPTKAEQWENVMVKIQNAMVTANNLPYYQWKVSDGSGPTYVDDDSDSIYGYVRPPVGTTVQLIRGWMYNHYGFYSDSSSYQIEPLYRSDIVIGSGPPDVVNCIREPGIPHPEDDVNLICEITDNSMVDSCQVYYSVNNGAYQVAHLNFTGGFFWEGSFPTPVNPGDWVNYFIRAVDDSGNVGIEPPDTTLEMFCFPVTTGNILTCHDVQYTPWPAGNSPFKSYEVSIEGVVTTDSMIYNDYKEVVLQDADAPWGGIGVSWITQPLNRGQKAVITGTVVETDPEFTYKWTGLTKLIDVSQVSITGTGTRSPLSVNTWALSNANPAVESYESVLVTVHNVTVTSVNQYDWTIDDGSGPCLIDDDASRLDSLFGLTGPGSTFESITGFFTYSYGTYKIELRDEGDYSGFLAVKNYQPPKPFEFSLDQSYPNPFNATTKINYTLPNILPVKLVVYDVMGRQIRILVDGAQIAGQHTAIWDGKDASGKIAASGVYLYAIKAGDNLEYRKMVLLK
ncbi:MAG: T9SS type A sorting domain-containing protein [bacterium]|nr:T9SS type A sorting domain-containing protein [bacterium]